MRGSVTKRGRGWRLKFDIDHDADGRRQTRYMTVHGSKKQAEEELVRQLAAVSTGTTVSPDTITLGQYLRGYLDGRHDLQPMSRRAYADVFTRLAAPIAHIQLQKLKPLHIKTWLDGLHAHGGKNGKPLSAVSVKHAHRALSSAIQAAVVLEVVGRNVCAIAKPPAAEVAEVSILGPEEISGLLKALKGRRPIFCGRHGFGNRMPKGRIVRLEVAGRRFRQVLYQGSSTQWRAPAGSRRQRAGTAKG